MDNSQVVAVADGLQELLDYLCRLVLGEAHLRLDRLEQLHSLAQLGDEEVVDVVLEDLEDLHDVGVVQLAKD